MSKGNSQAREFAESLSALMDNESNELELRRLLKEMPGNQDIARTWDRYNLTRALLHKEEVRPMSAEGTQSLLAALAAEAPYASGKPAGLTAIRAAWMQTAGRMAIAATVALAVFAGMQSALDQGIPGSQVAQQDATRSEEQNVRATEIAANSGFDAEAQQRLNDYIRGVSIQYREDGTAIPAFNILQDSQLIRQVNQIEN